MASFTDDPYRNDPGSIESSARGAFAVSASDSVNFTVAARALYIGGAGDVAVVMATGDVVTFKAVPAGTVLPVRCTRVNSTNTSATDIVGLI